MQNLKGRKQATGQRPGQRVAKPGMPTEEGIIDFSIRKVERDSRLDGDSLRKLSPGGRAYTAAKDLLRLTKTEEDSIMLTDNNGGLLDTDALRESLRSVVSLESCFGIEGQNKTQTVTFLYCGGDVGRRFVLLETPVAELRKVAPHIAQKIPEDAFMRLMTIDGKTRHLYPCTAEAEEELKGVCFVRERSLAIEKADLKNAFRVKARVESAGGERVSEGERILRAAFELLGKEFDVVELQLTQERVKGMRIIVTSIHPSKIAGASDEAMNFIVAKDYTIIGGKYCIRVNREPIRESGGVPSPETKPARAQREAPAAEEDVQVALKKLIEEAYRIVEGIADDLSEDIRGEVKEEVVDGRGGIAVLVSNGRNHYMVTNMDAGEACREIGRKLSEEAESQKFTLTEIMATAEPRVLELGSGATVTVRTKAVGLLVTEVEQPTQTDTLQSISFHSPLFAMPASVADLKRLLLSAVVDDKIEGQEAETKQGLLDALGNAVASARCKEEAAGAYSEVEDASGNAYAIFRLGRSRQMAERSFFSGTIGTITFSTSTGSEQMWYMLACKEFLTPAVVETLLALAWKR